MYLNSLAKKIPIGWAVFQVGLLCSYHAGTSDVLGIGFLCYFGRMLSLKVWLSPFRVARFSNITHSLPLPSIFPPIGSIFGKSDAAEAEEVGEKIATDCDIEVRFVLRLLL